MSRNKKCGKNRGKDKEARTDWPLTVMEMFSRHPDKAVSAMLLVSTKHQHKHVNLSTPPVNTAVIYCK